LCLTYVLYHPRRPAAVEVPVAWAPCRNVTADPLVWAEGPDYELSTQLWALDGTRGIVEPWHWADATNATSPQLVLNEVGYGPTRRHLVPLLMSADTDAGTSLLSSVHRLRVDSGPTTVHWGDAGCHGHGLCDVDAGTCQCFKGFGGSDCLVEVNECFSRPCFNDGVCIEGQRAGTYECVCTPDAFGSDCELWTTVQASVILEGDMNAVGIAGSQERDDFERAVAADLAALLEVALSRVVIDSVVAGSLIVTFSVRADGFGTPVASTVLLDVLGADAVSLGGLQVQDISVTRQADAVDVSATQPAIVNTSYDSDRGGPADDNASENSSSSSDSSSASWNE